MTMVPVDLPRTLLLSFKDEYVVLLKSSLDNRALPITVGQFEAQAIAIKLNNLPVPRPLTHDLFKSVLEELKCALVRVEVCDLKDRVFYARLILERDGRTLSVDSRPSDAVALAVRFSTPVFIDEEVLSEAGVEFDGVTAKEAGGAGEGEGEQESTGSPVEILQKELARAVEDERYEEAAKLRDQIRKMTAAN
jgi:bifunctional DNase/RNase